MQRGSNEFLLGAMVLLDEGRNGGVQRAAGSQGGKRDFGIETRIDEWQGKTLRADCVVEQSQLLHVSLRLSAIRENECDF